MKPIYKKIPHLCSAITIVVYLICGFYSHNINTNTSYENQKYKPRSSPEKYDTKITGLLDSSRLGYATLPQFQVKPKSWNDVLKDVKWKILQTDQIIEHEIKSSHSNSTNPNTKHERPAAVESEPNQLTTKTKISNVKVKQILIYEDNWWGAYNGCKKDKSQNPEFPCEYSNWSKMKKANKSLVFADVANNFDAVAKYRDFSLRKLILSINSNNSSTLKRRTKIIYHTVEAPGEFQVQMKPMFKDEPRDLLASYWRGSDIYTPYFRWEYYNESITYKHQTKNFAEGRTKMAAIVVSNCKPHNDRLSFVKELQKYIQVDVFGKCGTISCQRRRKGGDCFSTIKKNYKFYLAFENTMCRDYITEKLGNNAFKNDLLPIVMGAHPSDYKAIAPANSYIHVEDFESIGALGRFLLQLHKNDVLYNSYFAWKDTGKFRYANFLCDCCTYLHAEDVRNVLGTEEFRESSFAITQLTQEKAIPYLNMDDTYDHDVFNVSRVTEDSYKLCLENDVWYWNR